MSRTSSPVRFHLTALAVGAVALLVVACGSPANPTAPSPLSATSNMTQGAGGAPQSSAGKVNVCHRSGGGFHLINVSGNAVKAHLDHGDGLPGGAVPGSTGQVFDANCQVLKKHTLVLVSGASGGIGSLDPSITYTKASGGSGTAVILSLHPYYVALAGAQYVNWAIRSDGYGTEHPGDDVTYSTSFTLPAGAINPSLSGTFYADNRGDGFLNGTAIGGHAASPFQQGHTTPASISASGGFVSGANTLSFRVRDDNGIAGLAFSVTVTYWAP